MECVCSKREALRIHKNWQSAVHLQGSRNDRFTVLRNATLGAAGNWREEAKGFVTEFYVSGAAQIGSGRKSHITACR